MVSFFGSLLFTERGDEGEESMQKYFANWSPYRIWKVHVKLIGNEEINRPGSEVAGIEETREMYHFARANIPRHEAATTTDRLEDVRIML